MGRGKGSKNKGEGGLGARGKGTPATKTPIYSFLRPLAAAEMNKWGSLYKWGSDWLIFDSTSHRNDVI